MRLNMGLRLRSFRKSNGRFLLVAPPIIVEKSAVMGVFYNKIAFSEMEKAIRCVDRVYKL